MQIDLTDSASRRWLRWDMRVVASAGYAAGGVCGRRQMLEKRENTCFRIS